MKRGKRTLVKRAVGTEDKWETELNNEEIERREGS